MDNRWRNNFRPGELPEWIFRWRHGGDPLFAKVMAVVICGAVFAFFLTMVRVRVLPPLQPEGRNASLIYLAPGPEANAWALRAREGGPFPSRFELVEWPGAIQLEQEVRSVARLPQHPYQVKLQELPAEQTVPPVLLADRGQRVFPDRPKAKEENVDFGSLTLTPVIYPLSNLSRGELPDHLPPFAAKIDATLSTVPWRMIARLRADGSVVECVTLTGDSAPGAAILEKWLHGVRFRPSPAKASLWVSIAIGFVNTSAPHGTESQ